jgi:ribosomal-protein-alanine N-acetyltransferase
VVAIGFERRGLGRALVRSLAEALDVAGVENFLLEVRAGNARALAFYRVQGWVECGRRPRYYADPEEDAILMSLRLG